MLDMAGYVAGRGLHLSQHRIIEPSCGDGAFLDEIIRRLITDASPAATDEWADMRNAIHACDIDERSVNRCRASASELLRESGCPDDIASRLSREWIVRADFLLTTMPKADWIVGNPPYIRATDMDIDTRRQYISVNDSMTAGADIYIGFYDHAIDTLNDEGTLCFICSDRWLQNQYGTRLREKVATEANLDTLIRMHGVNAFAQEVDAYPAITLITKSAAHDDLRYVECSPDFNEENVAALTEWLSAPATASHHSFTASMACKPPYPSDVFPLGKPEDIRFVMQAQETLPKLEATGIRIGIGVATGCDAVFITDDHDLVEHDRLLPLFYMRDHRRHIQKQRWLVNPWDSNGALINLDDYPLTEAYFNKYHAKLSKRNIAKRHAADWFRTIDKVNLSLMNRDLLLMPDLASDPSPILSRGKYPHHNCYWIASDIWDLTVLGGLLMSNQTKTFIDCLGVKMRGRTLRFQAQYLRLLHIPRYEDISRQTRETLSHAFNTNDRELATTATAQAYKEASI